jgi:chromosome segregation ATPase
MNGNYQARYSLDETPASAPEAAQELEHLRSENTQLRALCAELEQALQEATQQAPDVGAYEERMREFETLLEEKNETIRLLHQQMQEAQAAAEEADGGAGGPKQGPVPREDELLQLSEDLENERRQLQEDEQSLMEQMRQMEMSMARERAEMARQRNDLQRLYGEIRHEMERLERNGALQSKMEELKAKLQDVQNRRGSAPTPMSKPASSSALPPAATPSSPPSKKESFMGRFFGK